MNKSELINKIATSTKLTKKDAGKALDSFIEAVADAMQKEEKIQLVGFGCFSVKNRAARIAKNPRTGESMIVPASKAPVFKPGKELKDRINK